MAIRSRRRSIFKQTTALQSQTFSYTGVVQQWIVPVGVTSVGITLNGARGGGHWSNDAALYGSGARVISTLSVVPGETLNIYVGGRGVKGGGGQYNGVYGAGTGGWNGGGNGGNSSSYGSGSGGGGASDIRRTPYGLSDRLAVAGGGGGSAGWGSGGGNGGANGDGSQPQTGSNQSASSQAGGGNQTSGGAAGASGTILATAGIVGQGGSGGGGASAWQGGGGGGGGYYGGGGGGAAFGAQGGGGGGGSSMSTGINTTIIGGAHALPGEITIEW